jgi:hypothetical protein
MARLLIRYRRQTRDSPNNCRNPTSGPGLRHLGDRCARTAWGRPDTCGVFPQKSPPAEIAEGRRTNRAGEAQLIRNTPRRPKARMAGAHSARSNVLRVLRGVDSVERYVVGRDGRDAIAAPVDHVAGADDLAGDDGLERSVALVDGFDP